MNQELEFKKHLDKVMEIARTQGNTITEAQVEEIFDQLLFNKEQLSLVFSYLKEQHVAIGEDFDADAYLSEEELDFLAMYLEDLKNLPKVTEGQKEAICLSAMAGETDAKKKLIEIYLPQVVEVAKLYAGQGVFIEDLIGEGNVALTMGVELLGCLEKPSEVEGMLGKLFMDAMEEAVNEHLEASKGDETLLEAVNMISEKAEELAELLQRKITIAELATELSKSEEEIYEAVQLSAGMIEWIEMEQNNNL